MATKTVYSPVVEQSKLERVDTENIGVDAQEFSAYQNGQRHGEALWPKIVPPPADRAHLPTLPWEMGWREYTDPETGESCRAPLTLLDIHFPTEDDVGVVFMAQGFLHDLWSVLLASLLRGYRNTQEWLTLHDVLIYWEQAGVTPTAPDLAVIPHAKIPEEDLNSYHVGRDGPLPCFVAEITSKSTRNDDLHAKPTTYAAVGIREYLIIDIRTPKKEAWCLIGYQLTDSSPYYQELTPDAEGGLTFATIGLRFVAVGRSHIEVYDVTTGERLLTLDEQKARAEAAEQENKELKAEIARLRALVAKKQ